MDRPSVNHTTQRLSTLEGPYRPLMSLSTLNELIASSEAVA